MVDRDEVAIVSGRSFMLSNGLGDIAPGARHGLFDGDTRFLSLLRVTLDGQELLYLGGAEEAEGQARFYATNPELPAIPAGSILVERERRLNGRLSERITVTNHTLKPHHLRLRIELATDFADVLELHSVPAHKLEPSGVPAPPRWHHAFAYQREDFACHTLVRWSRHGQHENGTTEFAVALQPRQRWQCQMRVEMLRGEKPDTLPPLVDREERSGERRQGGGAIAASGRQSRERETPLGAETLDVELALVRARALADLRTLTFRLPTGERIVGAGLPYFMTLFGRDSVLTAYQTLSILPRLATDVLRALARHQGVRDDFEAEEEPGKIPHEVRDGELAQLGDRRHGRYYGSVDATPLFMILFSEYLKRTGDLETREALWPAAEAALAWIDRYGDADGDGFIEYQRRSPDGLENQGWKDSWDAIAFANGRLAEAPIALCEVQGYVFDAKVRMADLYEQRGDEQRALELRREARDLQGRFEAAFWLPKLGTYALALDRNKRPVNAVASNAGHCLWSGIASPEHAAVLIARLSQPDCFSGWGLRTLSSTMARYNPISYHNGSVWPHDTVLVAEGFRRYGHNAAARRLLLAIVDAALRMPNQRLPELFAGSPRETSGTPALYPDANTPQAWAAGATLLACELLEQDGDLSRRIR